VKLGIRLALVLALLGGAVAASTAASPSAKAASNCPQYRNFGTKNPSNPYSGVDGSMTISVRSCDGGRTLYMWVKNNYPSGKTAVYLTYRDENVQHQPVYMLDMAPVTLPAGQARYYPGWVGPTQYPRSTWPNGTLVALKVYYGSLYSYVATFTL